MKIRKYIKTLSHCFLLTVLSLGMVSCEDYLEKNPDSTVNEEEPFKNFTNFQGYIEEIYNCIPDKFKCYYSTSWNLGDDEIMNPNADWHMNHQVDIGNFWGWQGGKLGQPGFWFDMPASRLNSRDQSRFYHALYGHAWYCIAKINTALANIDNMVGTKEERNLILGQLYFFRAWWHFEMMEFLGGLPYIDVELSASEQPRLPRLSYLECADKAAEDFKRAAELLPIDWDKTTVGKNTIGHNQLRVNKIMALGYLGKNYLWAASPLMQHGAQTGGTRTYDYNEDYCRLAAEAFGQLLNLVETGQTQYELASFDYKNIYDHEKNAGVEYSFSEIFFSSQNNWQMPGAKEAIFRGPSTNAWSPTRYNFTRLFGPNDLCSQDNIIHQPTANYVSYYGMENGLPLDDPDSGYDPNFPFKGRDPRFYHDIIFDGFKYVNGSIAPEKAHLRYCSLYTGGAMRAVSNASRTGYFYQKFCPHTCNATDAADDYGKNPHAYLPYMRLADVYLMYAEACAAVDGANGKSTNFDKTAEDALNVLRDRVGAGHINVKFTGDKNKFMDELRRERAVELAFEGFRFNDLQRWLLLTEAPYTKKTSHEFIRVESDDFFTKNDPRNAQVAELHEEEILTRVFIAKHYWWPLKQDDTYMYEGFNQNPGW